METIAVTYWNGLISPLYDAAEQFMIFHGTKQISLVSSNQTAGYQRVALLRRYATEVVICGAISQTAHEFLNQSDIKVVSWICGAVDSVVQAYHKKEGDMRGFFMPGYRCPGPGKCKCAKRRGRWENK